MESGRDQPGDVGHVHHQRGSHLARDAREALEVDHARIGARSRDDEARAMLARQRFDLLVIDAAVVDPHAILHRLEQSSGERDRVPMRQVAAMGEAHPEQGRSRVRDREVRRQVRRRPGMRLDVGVLRSEQRVETLEGQGFGNVHELAAHVVALARKALRILVVHHRAERFEDRRAGEVLGGDHLEGGALALLLGGDRGMDRGILLAQLVAHRCAPWATS